MPRKATPLFLVYSGEVLEGLVYRAVVECPPALGDLQSYEAIGMPYPARQHFRATGVSMFADRRRLEMHAREFPLPPAIATLDLGTPDVVWTRAGASAHITVWAPAAVLLGRVIQCHDHG